MSLPNILYIHSHDTGRYIQPYGHAIPTPHMQRLAEQGVLFRNAFSAAPTCSPSRAALLTGQAPHNSGMLGLAHRGFALNDYQQHLIHTLRQAGYVSVLIGAQHVAHDPYVIGYDEIIPAPGTKAPQNAPQIAAATDTFLHQPPQQPFFVSVGFNETHRAFTRWSNNEDPRYCLPPTPLPDTPEVRQDMADFKASAVALDQGIGVILDRLDLAGLTDNTLVICTTDHGLPFPAMKANLTDHGIGVMLIVRGPGGFIGGQVSDALVSHIDIFPTICDLIGVEPPTWLQGHSLLPLMRKEVDQIRDTIFAEVTYHAAYEPQRGIRTTRWKYIRRFEDRATPVLPNCDDGFSKDVWLQHDWQQRNVAQEQLYDLLFDPNECNNLINHPELQPVVADLRSRLQQWMQDTNDPLLAGPVPAPPNARITDVDAVSTK